MSYRISLPITGPGDADADADADDMGYQDFLDGRCQCPALCSCQQTPTCYSPNGSGDRYPLDVRDHILPEYLRGYRVCHECANWRGCDACNAIHCPSEPCPVNRN